MNKTQEQLKAEFLAELKNNSAWRNDQHMIDYIFKNASVFIELENGGIFYIEKPTIKKDFCFGYDTDSTGDSFRDAQETSERCRNSIDFFMNENLENLNDWEKNLLEILKTGSTEHGHKLYLRHQRNSDKEECKIYGFDFYDDWRYKNAPRFEEYKKKAYNPTKKDIENILEGYRLARDLFTKRLKSYLKRYGLTKLNTWTYWRDE